MGFITQNDEGRNVTAQCENCRFYARLTSIDGTCRKYAPRPIHWQADEPGATWPEVQNDDYCYEWEC